MNSQLRRESVLHSVTSLRCLIAVVLPLAAVSVCLADDASAGKKSSEVRRLVDVLESDAPEFKKAKACYRLAVIGGDQAVPALAKLLTDENLSNYGRHGLERIATPAAKAALRDALSKVQGDLLVGVIGSLGRVADDKAAGQLTPMLFDADRTIAMAASRALGRIGTTDAEMGLLAMFEEGKRDKNSTQLLDVSAAGCVICAHTLAEKGKLKLALELCDKVRESKAAREIRLSALHSSIVLRGKDGGTIVRDLIRSGEWADFQTAMRAAREIDVDVSKELIAQFEKQEPGKQVILVAALADLGNKAALSTLVKVAQKGDSAVRAAAFDALVRLGDETAIPVLVAAAIGGEADSQVAKAAQQALIKMESDDVDKAVLAMFAAKDVARLKVAVHLAAYRLMPSASPHLWKLTEHEDSELRLAAMRALGTTARVNDWPRLLALATIDKDDETRKAVRAAARAASERNPQDELTAAVEAALTDASPETRPYLIDLLGQIGGAKSLAIVVSLAKSKDEGFVNEATRVLGDWKTPDVAPELLELTKTITNRKYKIRTLRGYIRVARHLTLPIGDRLDICDEALKLIDRADERMLVLDVLRVHGAPRGMRIAVGLLDDKESEVMEQAARVIVILARAHVREFPGHAEKALIPALKRATNERVQTVGQDILAKARLRKKELAKDGE